MSFPIGQKESIAKLTRLSGTQVQLAPSLLKIGGLFRMNTQNITCNISTVGVDGLDTGSPTAISILYFYAVISGGAVRLIASLSSTLPAGFTAARFVGAYNVNHSSILGGLLLDSENRKQRIHWRGVLGTSHNFDVGTYNRLNFNGAGEIDTHLIADHSVDTWFFMPVADKYQFMGNVVTNDTGVGFAATYQMAVFKNTVANSSNSSGILVYGQVGVVNATPYPWSFLPPTRVPLVQGDRIDFRTWQSGGPSRNVSADARTTYGEIIRPGDEG